MNPYTGDVAGQFAPEKRYLDAEKSGKLHGELLLGKKREAGLTELVASWLVVASL